MEMEFQKKKSSVIIKPQCFVIKHILNCNFDRVNHSSRRIFISLLMLMCKDVVELYQRILAPPHGRARYLHSTSTMW